MKTITGKVLVLGDAGVGKTCTVIRHVENTYKKQIATVGASFFDCTINVDDNTMVKLQIWDTSGQERYKAMIPMFYRQANAALLTFDITSEASFENVKWWVSELKENVKSPMVLCLVGNKIDLANERKVSKDEAIQYSNSIGASYFECSAKTNQGVRPVFENLAIGLSRLKTTDTTVVNNVNIRLGSKVHTSTRKSKCCSK